MATKIGKRAKRKQRINETAEYLIHHLKKHGVVVQRYKSKSSNSIYLKLDYGVMNSIRISDHEGKEHLNYKYNLLTYCFNKSMSKVQTAYGEVERFYYPIWSKKALLKNILKERKRKLFMYGEHSYKQFMEIKIAENYAKTGFWQLGEIV